MQQFSEALRISRGDGNEALWLRAYSCFLFGTGVSSSLTRGSLLLFGNVAVATCTLAARRSPSVTRPPLRIPYSGCRTASLSHDARAALPRTATGHRTLVPRHIRCQRSLACGTGWAEACRDSVSCRGSVSLASVPCGSSKRERGCGDLCVSLRPLHCTYSRNDRSREGRPPHSSGWLDTLSYPSKQMLWCLSSEEERKKLTFSVPACARAYLCGR